MKILFDTSAMSITQTGVHFYIKELLSSLRGARTSLDINEYGYIPVFSRNSPLRILDTAIRDTVWQRFKLHRKAIEIKADIIHYPAFINPSISYNKTREVLTIHDAYTFRAPQHFNAWHRYVINKSIETATKHKKHIIVPSSFVKSELLDIFPNALDNQIHVIHSGIPSDRAKIVDQVIIETTLHKLHIKKSYILSVSTLEPRKNFITLLKAFNSIKHKIDHTLVLVGQPGWKYAAIHNLIKELKLENDVVFTGYVSATELNVLYSKADCFVFPSLYEGFGFTPLEALKCECPVISSNAACMPEILGNAAQYFDPENYEELAQLIVTTLYTNQRKNEIAAIGIERALKFNWKLAAEKTINLYTNIVSE